MVRRDYSCAETALAKWGTLTLAAASLTSLVLRYVTDPVSCWAPAQFTTEQVTYAHHSCFQSHSIHRALLSEELPENSSPPRAGLTYHQWLPFFLGCCAILCLLPHVIWRTFTGLFWLDAHALVTSLADNQRGKGAERHVMLRDSALLLQAGLKGGNTFLSLVTMGRKLLCGVVCLLQVLLMATVFAPQLSALGRGGEEEGNSSYSPLPTVPFLCEYEVRARSNVVAYTLQCVMPLSQVYSKGLAFFFYFFFVLLCMSVLDILTWAGRIIIPGLRDVTLKRYLAINSQSESQPRPSGSAPFSRFLESLGLDGRLLIAVTADHCGPLAASDLTNHLWFVFKGTPRPGPASSSGTSHAPSWEAAAIPLVTVGESDGDRLAEKEKPV